MQEARELFDREGFEDVDLSLSLSSEELTEVLRLAEGEDTPLVEEEKRNILQKLIAWLKRKFFEIKLPKLKLTFENLLSFHERAVNGTIINCPTELRQGDHVAIKTKRCYLWWNHMIVTDVYSDGFDVICPCTPSNDPQQVKLDSDYFSVKDLGQYFGMECKKPELEISEFPIQWDSVKRVVRFDEESQFTQEKIVERARQELGSKEWCDMRLKSSQQFVNEMTSGSKSLDQKLVREQGIALVCETTIGQAISLISWIAKTLFKFLLHRGKSGSKIIIETATISAKMVKFLNILGFCIGPIIDIVVCVIEVGRKYNSFKKQEITKDDFYKYLAQSIAELVTNIIFALLQIPCYFIPVPAVSVILAIVVGIIGFIVSKALGWLVGFTWDKIRSLQRN